jgi:hypothetical protein
MSWLHFSRETGKLSMFAGDAIHVLASRLIDTWEARNETARSSRGHWPDGTWKWAYYNAHSDGPGAFIPGCFSTAYGCTGIHVFDVPAIGSSPARTGMGVHAGRQTWDMMMKNIPGGVTMGCIRTIPTALITINSIHATDKLKAIVIGNHY